jgi:phosphoadenosine phosphosulfate reductase
MTLVPSNRHTKADLRLWAEYEDADLVHAANLDAKIDRSLRVIADFAAKACYVGVSWGKDSTVLAHLIAISKPKIPVVWHKIEPIKSPECETVRDHFLAQWPLEYHEITRWCRRSKNEWHASGTLESAAAEAVERFGERRMLGIRADESGERRLTCLLNGTSSTLSCRPIAWWTVQDVFSYLARFNLPVHPAYAMLGNGRYERSRLRVASLGGKRGDGLGRAEWEREYYGDVLARLSVSGDKSPG